MSTEALKQRVEELPVESGYEPRRPGAQLNLFTGKAEPVPVEVTEEPEEGQRLRIDEGIALVKTDSGSQVILSGFGIFLSKKSERLIVRKSKEVLYQFPFFRLSDVVIASRGVTLSSDLVEELCERGIQISFLTNGGKPYAMLTSPMLTATVQTRREQIRALGDGRGLEFSKRIVEGKIRNQERLLRYFGKYLKQTDPERFDRLIVLVKSLRAQAQKAKGAAGNQVEESRGLLMGLEGTAGRLYWDGVREIIGHKVEFFGREHQGATDIVNSLLNYGYGILYSQVWGAVLNAGLEPFAGFLHVDRPGKPSLVLDLVEEFRQPVVDRAVIAHVNLGEVARIKDGLLDVDSRKTIGARVLERMESVEMHQGKRYQVRSIIQMQARRLASFLRGNGEYRPFRFKW